MALPGQAEQDLVYELRVLNEQVSQLVRLEAREPVQPVIEVLPAPVIVGPSKEVPSGIGPSDDLRALVHGLEGALAAIAAGAAGDSQRDDAMLAELKVLSRRMGNLSGGGGPSSLTVRDDPSQLKGIAVHDDYLTGEVLADQAGSGGVLTFTFTKPVDLLWITDIGTVTTNVSRANPFGGTPTSSTGIPVANGTPTPVTVTTSQVQVFAPTGSTINVYGYRRVT